MSKPDYVGKQIWLRSMRSKCRRRLTGTGKDNEFGLFRLWVIYLFEEKYRLDVLSCRHKDSVHRPSGMSECRTCGVRDHGKAMGFVLHDLKANLRQFIEERLGGQKKLVDQDDSDEDEPVFEEDEDLEPVSKRIKVLDSQDSALEFQSSDPSNRRVSTKVRVHLLSYLYGHSRSDAEFEEGYRALVDANDQVIQHLCGCGCSHGQRNACVEPTHLQLGSQAENRDHTPLHRVLEMCEDDYPMVQKAMSRVFPGLM